MTYGQFPYIRGRRLRASVAMRDMVAEHNLKPADFIAPVFVMEGEDGKVEIPSMPDYYRYTLDLLMDEIRELKEVGIRSVLVFAKVPDDLKDTGYQRGISKDVGDDRYCHGSIFELRSRRHCRGWRDSE